MTDVSQNITADTPMETSSVYDNLRKRCALAGVSLLKACEAAQVDYSTIAKWKKKNPKTIETHERLIAAIERLNVNNA